MMDDSGSVQQIHMERKRSCTGGVTSGIYCLAFIGAVIYYIQHAMTFWGGVLGILKAIVWPALLIYKLLGFLTM